MLFPTSIVNKIANFAYWADRTIRSELAQGLIANENDYTSNLTSTFRRQINASAIPGLKANSYVLQPRVERTIGADGCIVLSNTKEFKICVFESKWPRLSTHENCWDSLQRASSVSHFHEQLTRQSHFSGSFAIWEMFYSEYPFGAQPRFMPKHVSACVWHEHAYNSSNARASNHTPWTDIELEALLSTHGSHIDLLIRDVCDCKHGQLFSGQNYRSLFDDYGIPSQILVIEYASPQAGG